MEHPMKNEILPMRQALLKRLNDSELKKWLRDYAMPYKELMAYYRCAMMEVETKFNVLNEELSLAYDRNPIETIKSRLKSPESIVDKVARKGLPLTIDSIEKNIRDIAGIRVICSFPSDIYMLADCLLSQDDITLIERKDYIEHPKPNGYRSLHLIVEIPIFLHNQKRLMKVEVQLRTISMDCWASLEHKIFYKKNVQDAQRVEQELIACLREGVPGLVSVCMSVNMRPDNVILGDSYRVLWGQERLRDTLCGNAFLLSPLSFFQVNPEQTERLYRTALDFAQLRGDETVADVYCGAGTITLMLARHAARVIGIEIVPDAIRDAKENARLNGVENAQFYCGAAESILPELVRQGLRPDVIVLDPPRKGADEAVLRAIAVAQPARVVYISCNPATQARDARILCAMGYAAQRCQPVDMFCQTAGVENVMLFERRQAAEQP